MPTVRDLLARKSGEVISIAPSDTVLAAAQVMNQHGIGGLVVLDEGTLHGRLHGAGYPAAGGGGGAEPGGHAGAGRDDRLPSSPVSPRPASRSAGPS